MLRIILTRTKTNAFARNATTDYYLRHVNLSNHFVRLEAMNFTRNTTQLSQNILSLTDPLKDFPLLFCFLFSFTQVFAKESAKGKGESVLLTLVLSSEGFPQVEECQAKSERDVFCLHSFRCLTGSSARCRFRPFGFLQVSPFPVDLSFHFGPKMTRLSPGHIFSQ
jgi:hypothetical protein